MNPFRTHRRCFFSWLIMAVLFATARSQMSARVGSSSIPNPPTPSSAWKPPTIQVAHTDVAPKIDGVMDDPCWRTATHLRGFYRFRSTDPVKEQTEAWICADDRRFYVAFHCLDDHPELIRASETQREGDLSHDDVVQIVIDSETNRRNVSQFTVSARGTQQTQLEGGTANNLTWAGDWTAVTRRTYDGWVAEISIPFALMRYPRGSTSFGFALARQLARETNPEVWPYIPPAGDNNPMPYLCDGTGIHPPAYAPKIVALPYVLGSAGATESLRGGIDVKYPVSTTLTGIASLFPDFQTVEDAVQNLSFSYTEKYLADSRPFFVEGSNYQNDSSLFYSQRVPMVDEGAKLVGKQGPTTIYALATNSRDDGNGQSAFVANVSQDLGLLSQVGFAALSNNAIGQPANRVARMYGQYGFSHKGREVDLYGNDTESTVAGGPSDRSDYIQLSTSAGHGRPGGSVFYSAVGPGFVNQLGLIPLVDLRGEGFNFWQTNAYDSGRLEYASFNASGSTYRHQTGGFLQDDLSASTFLSMRSGWGYGLSADVNKFWPYSDSTVTGTLSWGQKTLFRQGSLSAQIGDAADQTYRYVTLGQGILLSHELSINASLGYEYLGGQQNTQTILTGTYRLNPHEAIGGRMVQNNGNVDVYLSYSRRVRHGTDIFILIGDPNSPQTRTLVTVKLVHPF